MGGQEGEGKREAGKNREASRHGREEEKRENKNRQIERPELVAATDSPQTKLKTRKPRAQGRAFQLQQLWYAGRKLRGHARALVRDSQSLGGKLGTCGR